MTGMMRWAVSGAMAIALAGCIDPAAVGGGPTGALAPAQIQRPVNTGSVGAGQSNDSFDQIVARVEPVARQLCVQSQRPRCDFAIVIDKTPGQPPNASQSLGPGGQPVLTFNLALLQTARNAHEVAFVMGHEAAHHIAGHLPQTQQNAVMGAVLGAVLAGAAGGGSAEIERGQKLGASLAARGYSKEFELQADALGAEIAYYAGYDPSIGVNFFDQIGDPGDQFLGTHPANGDRKSLVLRTVDRLRRGG